LMIIHSQGRTILLLIFTSLILGLIVSADADINLN
jgi:hypothetical protein